MVNDRTKEGIDFATPRLVAALGGSLQEHRDARARQAKFVSEHGPWLRDLVIARIIDDYEVGDLLSKMEEWVDASPANKRPERRRFYEKLLAGDERIEWSVKERRAMANQKFENGKWGKYTRLFISLGVKAIALTGFAASAAKHALAASDIVKGNLTLRFVASPRLEALRGLSGWLRGVDEGHLRVAVFSDDSLGSTRLNGLLKYLELDLKSCDSSIGDPIFEWIESIQIGDPVFDQAIKEAASQMHWPVVIPCPSGSTKITIYPSTRMMYSGSSLTTFGDTVANMLGWYSLALQIDRMYTEQIELVCHEAFALVGFQITCVVHDDLIKGSFLKHFEVRNTEGNYEWILCLGTILRSFGVCLRGFRYNKMSYKESALQYLAGVAAGYVHVGNHLLTDAIRRAFGRDGTQASYSSWMTQNMEGTQLGNVEISEIATRYGLDGMDIAQMEHDLGQLEFGIVINARWVDKIMAVDYDLPPTKAATVRNTGLTILRDTAGLR